MIHKFETHEEWLAARLGKITGTRAKDAVPKARGAGKRIGFYEILAERLAIPADDEDAMARGTRLQGEAIERFEAATGETVDKSLVLWTREDNENIAVSPDGVIGETVALEVKCLSSARHLEALLTKEIPDEYHHQTLQYFAVNDRLQTLYVVFFDPRLKVQDFFWIGMQREQVETEVTQLLVYEKETLAEVDKLVAELTAF